VQQISRSSLLFSLLLAGFFVIPVMAQEPTPEIPTDDQVNAIAKQLYCPVCENIPLDVCPTQACSEWRELIREKLAEGWSEEQIKQYLVDRFGDSVLATPPPRGLNLLIYVIPPIAFLIGAYLLYRIFVSWRSPVDELPPDENSSQVIDQDEYIDRLEDQLRKL